MLYEKINQNKRKTIILLITFLVLLGILGASAGYLFLKNNYILGSLISLIVGVVYIIIMIKQSTNIVMKMNGAIEISENDMPEYYHIVEDMSMVAQVPMPRVFIIKDDSLNAFATGLTPSKSAVAATTGLLKIMNREELEAVIGHELSHIKNYDIRISTICIAIISSIGFITQFGRFISFFNGSNRRSSNSNSPLALIFWILSFLTILLSPLIALIIQSAISREREYLADASSVELTRNPQGMISALNKLKNNSESKVLANKNNISSALFISNPFKKDKLFSTHPPLDKRINRLKTM